MIDEAVAMDSVDSYVCIDCSECVRDHEDAVVVLAWASNGAAIVRCARYEYPRVTGLPNRRIERWH